MFKYLKPNKLQHQCELKASTGFLLLLCQPLCVQSDPVTYTLMQQILIHYLFHIHVITNTYQIEILNWVFLYLYIYKDYLPVWGKTKLYLLNFWVCGLINTYDVHVFIHAMVHCTSLIAFDMWNNFKYNLVVPYTCSYSLSYVRDCFLLQTIF